MRIKCFRPGSCASNWRDGLLPVRSEGSRRTPCDGLGELLTRDAAGDFAQALRPAPAAPSTASRPRLRTQPWRQPLYLRCHPERGERQRPPCVAGLPSRSRRTSNYDPLSPLSNPNPRGRAISKSHLLPTNTIGGYENQISPPRRSATRPRSSLPISSRNRSRNVCRCSASGNESAICRSDSIASR